MVNGLLNPTHIAILLIVVLLILGPKKLPDTGRALGRSMREFRDGITGRDNPPTETQTSTAPTVAVAPPPSALPASAPSEPTAAAGGQSAGLSVAQATPAAGADERTAA